MFWKNYRLRWMFYRRKPNMVWGKNDHTADKRCSLCKKGVGGFRFSVSFFDEYGNTKFHDTCPHGGDHVLIEEPNRSVAHLLYKCGKRLIEFGWWLLDLLHIVRSSYHGRYDMFGDEYKYVKYYSFDRETRSTKVILKERKWWEYIFFIK